MRPACKKPTREEGFDADDMYDVSSGELGRLLLVLCLSVMLAWMA